MDWFDVNVATAFLARSNDPTGEVLKILERRNVRLNWNDFIFALSTIGRWDVIDEAQPLFGLCQVTFIVVLLLLLYKRSYA